MSNGDGLRYCAPLCAIRVTHQAAIRSALYRTDFVTRTDLLSNVLEDPHRAKNKESGFAFYFATIFLLGLFDAISVSLGLDAVDSGSFRPSDELRRAKLSGCTFSFAGSTTSLALRTSPRQSAIQTDTVHFISIDHKLFYESSTPKLDQL